LGRKAGEKLLGFILQLVPFCPRIRGKTLLKLQKIIFSELDVEEKHLILYNILRLTTAIYSLLLDQEEHSKSPISPIAFSAKI